MKNLAVFGNPIDHSLSPLMHNRLYKVFGIDAEYGRELIENAENMRAVFDDRRLDGANITLPHKEAAFVKCDEVRGLARRIGAVNTWVRQGAKIIGYNTDAAGFMLSIKPLGEIKNALILGAGGAARAVAIALFEAGRNPVVLNRSSDRLKFFDDRGIRTAAHENLPDEPFDIVINTTSAGLKDSNLPLDRAALEKYLRSAKTAIDIIYAKETEFLKLAKKCGIGTMDGEDMLVFQGAIAHSLFFPELTIGVEECAKVMKEVLNGKS